MTAITKPYRSPVAASGCAIKMTLLTIDKTSQAEQGHTRVPSSPSSNWTQSIQQSSNIFDLFF